MRGADELLKFEEMNLPQENAVFHLVLHTGFLVRFNRYLFQNVRLCFRKRLFSSVLILISVMHFGKIQKNL